MRHQDGGGNLADLKCIELASKWYRRLLLQRADIFEYYHAAKECTQSILLRFGQYTSSHIIHS